MNRILFEKSEIDAEGRAVFGGVRADHAVAVLHAEPGQILKTGEVDGKIGSAVVERVEGEAAPPGGDVDAASLRVTVRCAHDAEAPAPWADLILALPRPRCLKRLLPQLAALGVGRIVLAGGEKTEKAYWGAQLLREEIHRPLLVEGLMQAGTSALPRVVCEKNLARWFAKGRFETDFGACANRILAHPYAVGKGARFDRAAARGRPLLAVGPEGGWTEAELALFDAHGFAHLSLGPRILRTDTACVALLAKLLPDA